MRGVRGCSRWADRFSDSWRYLGTRGPRPSVNRPRKLTGIVTTNDVIVSPQTIRTDQLTPDAVNEEAARVGMGSENLSPAVMPTSCARTPHTGAHNVTGLASQVQEAEGGTSVSAAGADRRSPWIRQAEATTRLRGTWEADGRGRDSGKRGQAGLRAQSGARQAGRGHGPAKFDQSRTTFDAAKAHVEALKRQVDAQRAAVALARSNAEQNTVKESQLRTNRDQLKAADAQRTKKQTCVWATQSCMRQSMASST